MQRLEVEGRVVQTQPHLLGSNFPPSIRQITGKPYSLVLESEQKQTLGGWHEHLAEDDGPPRIP
jgi:hypothetical protein